ncbi:MAG TPA: PilZ domain-containing protein, partial [Chthonomonadales bacterium]|nr:PilZ domain-containing protein [Chthonomonadales bacterium]
RREQRRKYVRADVRLDISLYARAQEPGPVVHAVVKAFDVPEAPPVSDSTEPERVSAEGVTDDLCVGGCAVITRRRIPVGATVDFEIGAASHEVSGRGLVIRSRPLPPSRHRDIVSDPERYRLVVQFDRLDSAARRTLESLIKEFN